MLTKASRAVAVAAMVSTLALCGVPGGAAAQQLSDRSVEVLMNYAWSILPTKFTTQTNKVIVVDKSKKDEVVVPVEVGRNVIKVARLSAHAQICNLQNAQTANYRAMMKVESDKNKWSDQQLLYISQLHLFTILWLTGNVEITQEGGEKNVAVTDSAKKKKPTCTDSQRKNVLKRIEDYVNKVSGKS